MSDILIKGMEMPKNCRTCPMLFDGHNYRWCNITGESLGIEETDNGRDEHCPLVEIPTPHGNLKDKSDIISLIEVMFCRDKDGMEHAIQCVKDALTVIEAEGSEI